MYNFLPLYLNPKPSLSLSLSLCLSGQTMWTQILLTLLFITMGFADLQNPDFESPPSNIPPNSPSLLLLNENNTIPGWTFEGVVQYVTSGPNISLPGNGHAIQLGQDAKINQTFRVNKAILQYILTFTLAPVTDNCSNLTAAIVSAPDRSSLFSLEHKYGKEAWESYGYYLGSWSDGELINLVIQSQATEADPNITCGPVVDTFLLKTVGNPIQYTDNLLVNGGFEVGPDFLNNSTEGILLNAEPSPTLSALQQWSVIGTVKYIDSKHYLVPQGNAAIEIVSGASGGIQTAATLNKGSTYNLDFIVGDANNSCKGDFIVGAQAGSTAQNFTLQSKGTGLIQNFSMTFKADSSATPISFISFTTTQTRDLVFCGPVIDNVVLSASYGLKLEMQNGILFTFLFSIVAVPQIIG